MEPTEHDLTEALIKDSLEKLQNYLDQTEYSKSMELHHGIDAETGQLTKKSVERIDELTQEVSRLKDRIDKLEAELHIKQEKSHQQHLHQKIDDEFDAYKVVEQEEERMAKEKAAEEEKARQEQEQNLQDIKTLREQNNDKNRDHGDIER